MYLSLMLVVSAQNLDGILRGIVVDAAVKQESDPPHAGAQITADNFRGYRSARGF
jgi:hypothetical protein